MKKVLVEREVWQAKDGKEFQTEDECREYELGLLMPEFYDLNYHDDLAQFLKGNKSELFRIMGWETLPEIRHPLMQPVSIMGGGSGPTFYSYKLSSGSQRRYSGTLCVQDSVGRSYEYDLPDIGDMVLEVREVMNG